MTSKNDRNPSDFCIDAPVRTRFEILMLLGSQAGNLDSNRGMVVGNEMPCIRGHLTSAWCCKTVPLSLTFVSSISNLTMASRAISQLWSECV